MKRIVPIFFVLAITVVSCHKKTIKPSKTITSETRIVDAFDGIDVQDAIDVEITQTANPQSVIVETNSNIQDYVVTEIKSGKLIIRIKENVLLLKEPTIKVHISTSTLNSLKASDASDIKFLNTFSAANLLVTISDLSTLVGDLNVTNSKFEISDASTIHVSGFIDYLDAKLSDASTLKDYNLSINTLMIDLSDASTAYLTVNNTIHVKASDASTLHYMGNATIASVNLSDASEIQKH